MIDKKTIFKYFSVLLITGFSFFYTSKVTNIIREKDPIMKEIVSLNNVMSISKIEPLVSNDEYIQGINGCKIDIDESYNRMKKLGYFDKNYIVFEEDEINDIDKYIISGNNKKRNVSIILLNINTKLNGYFKNNNIKVNYFLDSNYINNNISNLKEIISFSHIYNYGKNKNYSSKTIVYDNSIINNNFNNKSDFCLVLEKNDDTLKLCNSYKMKTIKVNDINNNLSYVKQNLDNGKIFVLDYNNYNEVMTIVKYIESRGYDIVYLDELLSPNNSCN